MRLIGTKFRRIGRLVLFCTHLEVKTALLVLFCTDSFPSPNSETCIKHTVAYTGLKLAN